MQARQGAAVNKMSVSEWMLSRREWIAGGAAALAALGIPTRLWALQADEELVDFMDYTPQFKVEAQASNPRVRCFDLRRLNSWITPESEFYTFNQTEVMQVDAAKWRLRLDGFVDHPKEFTLDELK